jgi:YVTN family beta-propeller protein
VKSRTKQSSMKRVNCHLFITLSTLLLMGVGVGTTTLPAQTSAYVTNSGSDTVSVINTTTNIVGVTIPLGQYPQGGP